MQKIISFNNGTIFKIIDDNGNYHYFDTVNEQIILKSSSRLKNLITDTLTVTCAVICVNEEECDDFSLTSNLGDCLLSNSGAFLLHN